MERSRASEKVRGKVSRRILLGYPWDIREKGRGRGRGREFEGKGGRSGGYLNRKGDRGNSKQAEEQGWLFCSDKIKKKGARPARIGRMWS